MAAVLVSLLGLFTGAAALPRPVFAAQPSTVHGATVTHDSHHDTSKPLRMYAGDDMPGQSDHRTIPLRPVPSMNGLGQTEGPIQTTMGTTAMPSTATNFEGLGNGFKGPQGTMSTNWIPSDENGSVGPNNYVETVNADLAVFDKSGTVLYGPVTINTLWSGFGGLCQTDNDGDPLVKYDRMADRWVIEQFAVNGTTTNYQLCIAVSKTSDPTGAYYRYSFSTGSQLPDYEKIGVWPDAYYNTSNDFYQGGNFSGATFYAFDRASMLAGRAATEQTFRVTDGSFSYLPSDLNGGTLPPAGAPNYIVDLRDTTDLNLYKFHVDWTTPANTSLTGPTIIPVDAFAPACDGYYRGTCVPQNGTSQRLESLGNRLMYRAAYRNFGDHEALVINHAVNNPTGGAGIRWYELRGLASTPTVYQSGTYAPDTKYRWIGGIAQDHQGNMGLAYSVSSATDYPYVAYSGRLANDPAGTLSQGETVLQTSSGYQTQARWGDYSNLEVDPTDDCTFWYAGQYLPGTGAWNWRTRIGSFKFPDCTPVPATHFSLTSDQSVVSLGGTVHITVTPQEDSGATSLGYRGTVQLSADSGVSGLPSSYTFVSSDDGVHTFTATLTSLGAQTITATDSSDPSITGQVTVAADGAPTITSANSATFTTDTSNTFTVTTTGYPAPTLSETGALPTSVSFVDKGDGTATLSGTPPLSDGGTYPITITADNGVSPPATQSFTLTINHAPAITSDSTTTFTVGTPGSFTVSATGFPTPALSTTGTLPLGVSFTDNNNGTGTLGGTPVSGSGGVYNLSVAAKNSVSPDATQSFTLTVDEAPSLTSANAATFTVGGSCTFTVAAQGYPVPALSSTGSLPTGVTFSDNGNGTATLAGCPSGSGGQYPLSLKAANGVGSDATQTFTLTIRQAPSITSANSTIFTTGTSNTFTIATTGYPAVAISETGALPSGVTFTDNHDGSATLAGTPSASSMGNYALTITAANSVSPDATQSFTLKVSKHATTLTYSGDTSAQYSDQASLVATLTDTASGTPLAGKTVTFTLGTQTASATTDASGVARATITITQAPGTVAFKATFDGTNDPVYASSTATPTTFTINPEAAVVKLAPNNPHAVQVTKAGGSAPSMTFTATIKDPADGFPGNISKAFPVTLALNSIGSGTNYSCTFSAAGKPSCSNSAPKGTTGSLSISGGTMSLSVTFAAGIAVNIYDVNLAVGGWYAGQDDSALAVYDPSLGGANGGGSVTNPQTAAPADFAFTARYNSSGGVVGKMIYVEHRAGGNAILKGNVMSTMAISPSGSTYPKTAKIAGKATLNGVGNYSYVLTGVDVGTAGTSSDQYGQQVTDSSNTIVQDLTYDPVNITNGNVFAGTS